MYKEEVKDTAGCEVVSEAKQEINVDSDEKEGWTQDLLLQNSRRFNIDLSPKVKQHLVLFLLLIIPFSYILQEEILLN